MCRLDENAGTREALMQVASKYEKMAARADAVDSAIQHGSDRKRDVA